MKSTVEPHLHASTQRPDVTFPIVTAGSLVLR